MPNKYAFIKVKKRESTEPRFKVVERKKLDSHIRGMQVPEPTPKMAEPRRRYGF